MAHDKHIAAIGSKECAKLYNIPIIEENINDEIKLIDKNTTYIYKVKNIIEQKNLFYKK